MGRALVYTRACARTPLKDPHIHTQPHTRTHMYDRLHACMPMHTNLHTHIHTYTQHKYKQAVHTQIQAGS
jgi:hypothetical protein